MATKQISVERFNITSRKSFEDVVVAIDEAIGHPEMAAFRKDVSGAKSYADLEKIIQRGLGPTGLMEFARYDLGEILRKQSGGKAPRILRLVAGNPLIMKQMVEHVHDAGSYAPVTILIDERPDGVHISYDRMASYLATYESAEAMDVARDLDAKVEAILTAAA